MQGAPHARSTEQSHGWSGPFSKDQSTHGLSAIWIVWSRYQEIRNGKSAYRWGSEAKGSANELRSRWAFTNPEFSTPSQANSISDGELGFCVHRWLLERQHQKNHPALRPEAGRPNLRMCLKRGCWGCLENCRTKRPPATLSLF